jgi:hypothetical protein
LRGIVLAAGLLACLAAEARFDAFLGEPEVLP